MKKKKSIAHADKPQSGQIDAIRRLIQQGNFDEARKRLAPLRLNFPVWRSFLALAWEIEDRAGMPWAAVARARDWVQASPGSAAALEVLRDEAMALGLYALAANAVCALGALLGKSIDLPPPEVTPLGPVTSEEALLIDVSRVLLQDGQYGKLIEQLADATNFALINNRALARFAQGDVTRALEDFENNWQRQPRNLFALERIVRLRIWHRGRDYAAGLAAPLKATVPQRPEDAFGKINGLILLGEWEAAESAWQSCANAEFWLPGSDLMRALFDHAGAAVALRAGNDADAAKRIRMAGDAAPQSEAINNFKLTMIARRNGKTDGGYVAIGELSTWFPIAQMENLRSLRKPGIVDVEAKVRQQFERCDAHAEYLGLAVEFGNLTSATVAGEILKQRAKQGDKAATAELISLLTCPGGPDGTRMNLMSWLRENELIPAKGSLNMLINGAITEIKPLSFRLTPEPTRENPYPPKVQKRYEEMVRFLHGHKLKEAHAAALEISQKEPEVAMSLANLALVKEALGEPGEVIEDLLHRALALDDSYVFARAGLAQVLARRGELDAATAMLEPALGKEEYHYSEWRTILLAQREIAAARQNPDALLSITQALRDLDRMQQDL